MRAVLERALDTLKPMDRSNVYLGAVKEMSMTDVAVVVNSTEAAMKVRLHRLFSLSIPNTTNEGSRSTLPRLRTLK